MRPSKFAGGGHCGVAALTAGLIFAGAALPANAIRNYTATPLGTLGGSNIYAVGWGINSTGQVVGASYGSPTSPHAFLFSGGLMQDLIPSAGSSVAYAINDNGQVTGTQGHAFLYSGGTVEDLGVLPGGLRSTGTSVNFSGRVTGYSGTTVFDMPYRAILFAGGVMQDLGTLGGADSKGYGINVGGQVTGSSLITGNAVRHAFLYSGGVMQDLGTLGGSNSEGFGINAGGQVTGYSDISGNAARHAFLYSGGAMQDLGTLGGTESTGTSINDKGEVVGWVIKAGTARAFLYSSGAMYDLNTLVVSGLAGPPLARATAINNSGQIVANDCGPTGIACQAYRLDPITSADIPMMSNWTLGAMSLLLVIAGSVGLRRATWSKRNGVLRRRTLPR